MKNILLNIAIVLSFLLIGMLIICIMEKSRAETESKLYKDNQAQLLLAIGDIEDLVQDTSIMWDINKNDITVIYQGEKILYLTPDSFELDFDDHAAVTLRDKGKVYKAMMFIFNEQKKENENKEAFENGLTKDIIDCRTASLREISNRIYNKKPEDK